MCGTVHQNDPIFFYLNLKLFHDALNREIFKYHIIAFNFFTCMGLFIRQDRSNCHLVQSPNALYI